MSSEGGDRSASLLSFHGLIKELWWEEEGVCGGGDDKRWNEELQKSKKGGEKGNQRENKGHVYRCLCLCERCENQPPEPHCALWRQGNIPLTAAWTLPHDDYPLAFGSFYSPTPSDLAEVCGKVNISSLSAMWRCKQLMGRIAVSFHGQLIQIKIRQLRPVGLNVDALMPHQSRLCYLL